MSEFLIEKYKKKYLKYKTKFLLTRQIVGGGFNLEDINDMSLNKESQFKIDGVYKNIDYLKNDVFFYIAKYEHNRHLASQYFNHQQDNKIEPIDDNIMKVNLSIHDNLFYNVKCKYVHCLSNIKCLVEVIKDNDNLEFFKQMLNFLLTNLIYDKKDNKQLSEKKKENEIINSIVTKNYNDFHKWLSENTKNKTNEELEWYLYSNLDLEKWILLWHDILHLYQTIEKLK